MQENDRGPVSRLAVTNRGRACFDKMCGCEPGLIQRLPPSVAS